MKRKILLVVLIILLLIPAVVLAHKGRTDNNGGHYDRSTGEYHYHHGYPAHLHPDGVCPYEDDNEDIVVVNDNNDSTETQSDYVQKVLSLEYYPDLLRSKQNTINNLLEQNEELNTKMFGWHIVYISIAILLIIYICYLKYVKKEEK